MIELSERTEQVVHRLFPGETERARVKTALMQCCGDNLPDCVHSTPSQMERIRFSVLKLSEGRIDKLEAAIAMAKVDWRDLFMNAGFGRDLDEHDDWYRQVMA